MDYNALKARAESLLDRFSDSIISYTKTDLTGYTQVYNPATNDKFWMKDGVEVPAPAPTTYTGTCLETAINDYFRAQGYVRENDKIVITSAIPKPSMGEKVTIDGEEYHVVGVSEIKPSTVSILYRITVRK
jgi:predicted patatin/cPLA2 family phospholipase